MKEISAITAKNEGNDCRLSRFCIFCGEIIPLITTTDQTVKLLNIWGCCR
jgi:hypothetical protein